MANNNNSNNNKTGGSSNINKEIEIKKNLTTSSNMANNNKKQCEPKCEPQEMSGCSWWKQLGYGWACPCAVKAQEDEINKIKKVLIQLGFNPKMAKWKYNLNTHITAMYKARSQGKTWRWEQDCHETAWVAIQGVKMFGMEDIDKLLPASVQFIKNENGTYNLYIMEHDD